MMRIPSELLPEILARHEQGQSDPAIVSWLASLDPPVEVTRVAVLGARRRAAAEPAGQKPSGAQGRAARAEQATREAADHAKRGAVIIEPDRNLDALNAHLAELQLLAAYQEAVRTDPLMTLPEKLRYTVALGQTMAKLKVDAEIQAEQDEIRKMRKIEQARMDSLRAELEREQRRLAAERRELEEARRQLAARQ